MSVIFSITAGVNEIGADGEIAQGTGCVVDGIWWGEEVAVGQTHLGACSSDLSLIEVLPPPNTAVGRGLEVCWETRNWVACVGAHGWHWRGITVRGGESCWVTARIGAEVGSLIHVNPESININAIRWTEERREFAVPVALGGRIEPVWKGGDTRPDNA